MSSTPRDAWEQVANDPDPIDDLGYEYRPLSVVSVEEGGEKYIFLPREEEHLTDSEFMIADGRSVRDLDDCR
ncbi:hypothetical protein [Haloarcula montana]|uniref:hypothetical protein n=1 Tax=Haloarcula montana TaxID=3111776 RepID=UPI002D77EA58|nr:hypothetical protein [Haloarcula sp. GH36]